MGLIKNKLNKLKRNKLFWERFGKKATTITVTTSIAFSALFGLVGCDHNKTPEIDIETPEVESETQKAEIEALKSVVESLNSIVSKMEDENAEIKAQMEAIESKMSDIENENVNQKEVILELTNLISQLQSEIDSLKEDLKELEETKPSNPSKDEIETLTNELAKAKIMLAISDAFENNYIHVGCDEKTEVECAPNGDFVASRGEYDDYGYYNKADNITFISNYGEESFTLPSSEEYKSGYNLKSSFISYFEDDSLVLDKTQSENNKYVFVDEEGCTITVNFENDQLKEVVTEYEVRFSLSSKECFDALLAEAKNHLKMIGIYDSYKKEVEALLNYQYKGVTFNDEEASGVAVYHGKHYVTEQKNGNGIISYSLQTDNGLDAYAFDANGNILGSMSSEESYDCNQLFKEGLMGTNKDCMNTITYDEDSQTYIITSTGYRENGIDIITEVKFNEDMSVDLKQIFEYNNEDTETEVMTFKIEKISKQKFNEIYNRISAIVENAKQQESGLTQ